MFVLGGCAPLAPLAPPRSTSFHGRAVALLQKSMTIFDFVYLGGRCPRSLRELPPRFATLRGRAVALLQKSMTIFAFLVADSFSYFFIKKPHPKSENERSESKPIPNISTKLVFFVPSASARGEMACEVYALYMSMPFRP